MTVPAFTEQSFIRPADDCAVFGEQPSQDLMQRLLDAAKIRKKAGQHILRHDRLVLSEPIIHNTTSPTATVHGKSKFFVSLTPSTSRSPSDGASTDTTQVIHHHACIDHTRLARRMANASHPNILSVDQSQPQSAGTSTMSMYSSPPSSTAPHSPTNSCYFSCSSVL